MDIGPFNISTSTYNVTVTPNATIAAWYDKYENQIVPRSFTSGYTVLSYLVSFIGAWTTLELFNQRTAGRGINNWFILLASSLSMGGVAIWCMHFIGNRAIVLVQGQDVLQISYNSAYTALSFFVPIGVLLGAFLAIGSNETVSLVRVCLGGSLAGLAICGMHYLGQAGITNYTAVYVVSNVIGSAIIAVVASITALSVFFMLRASWSGTWWKRGLCALVLAGAVSGMHWVATIGTSYRLRAPQWSALGNVSSSRNSTTIVVAVLSFFACTILLAFTIVSQMRQSRTRNKSQMVVLATAFFDKDGRLLVTTEGNLPNEKITEKYIERSFDDIFGISHPVYLWLFRTTRNWPGIISLIPGMRNHLGTIASHAPHSRPGTKTQIALVAATGEPIDDYSIVFRELFCVAAADLANDLGIPLDEVGVLYDEIVSTGQQSRLRKRSTKIKYSRSPSTSVDLERDGLSGFGRGQLLFLVRKVDRREAENLLANGFRFASLNNVIDILARSMRVEKTDLAERLVSMREYVNSSNILDPGVHLACFAIRAQIGGVFDVLVRRDARNQLPTMQLPVDKLEDWQIDYLETLDSKTVSVCLKVLNAKCDSEVASEREKVWATQLHDTLDALRVEIGEPYFCDAKLVCNPVDAPCRGFDEYSKPGVCKIIAFRIIVPINVRQPGPKLEFTPLKFFKMQQHVYPNSPDHAVWERKIYREFTPFITTMVTADHEASQLHHRTTRVTTDKTDSGQSTSGLSAMSSIDPLRKPDATPPSHAKTTDGNLLHPHAWQFWKSKTTPRGRAKPNFSSAFGNAGGGIASALSGINSVGGIMVSSAVTVDVNDKKTKAKAPPGTAMEMANLTGSGRKGVVQPPRDDPFGGPPDDFDIMFGGAAGGKALGMDVDVDGLGTSVEVVREICDPDTFVDELMHVTIDKRNG